MCSACAIEYRNSADCHDFGRGSCNVMNDGNASDGAGAVAGAGGDVRGVRLVLFGRVRRGRGRKSIWDLILRKAPARTPRQENTASTPPPGHFVRNRSFLANVMLPMRGVTGRRVLREVAVDVKWAEKSRG